MVELEAVMVSPKHRAYDTDQVAEKIMRGRGSVKTLEQIFRRVAQQTMDVCHSRRRPDPTAYS